jgi:hypothetical protein
MKKKISSKRTKPEPSPDPYYTESEALTLARQKVINATPAITAAIIEQAKTGSYTHARMLFDFIGLIASPPPTPEAEPLNPFIESLAQALGLKLPDLGTPPGSPSRPDFGRDRVAPRPGFEGDGVGDPAGVASRPVAANAA